MIGFAFAWVLGVAAAGVLAISALHLLSVRRPPELLLPTARFLPDRDVRAVSRTRRPSDVLLLLVRIAVLVTAGLAAAVPAWRSRARERVTLVVADRMVTRDTAAVRALVLGDAGVGTRMVFADTVASDGPAALMPVAWRAAAELARDAAVDSIDLHLLLSEVPDARDAGFTAWRAAWPGLVTTHHAAPSVQVRRIVVVAGDTVGVRNDDAVRAAFSWHAARVSQPGSTTHVDTVLLARGDGAVAGAAGSAASVVRVSWPQRGVPVGWRAVSSSGAGDSVAALAVGARALMGSFAVTALPSDSNATPIAWWGDGRVAATERNTATGCDREVAVVSDAASDILLSVSANALFDRLLAPCESRERVSAARLGVRDSSDLGLADAASFRDASGNGATGADSSPLIVPLLFALSLLLLFAEWRLRTRVATGAS